MTLLEQCQIWNEKDEYQKIIDTIEAIPEESRTDRKSVDETEKHL